MRGQLGTVMIESKPPQIQVVILNAWRLDYLSLAQINDNV